jgi:hypothetical protein
MDEHVRFQRTEKAARRIIELLELDLKGLTVYTELGSGNYAWTPIIAALADADKVYAFTRTSRYGTAEENVRNLDKITRSLGLEDVRSRIEVVTDRLGKHVASADIITNSGLLRPIDGQMIDLMKSTAVVPLMYETWEFRRPDIDLKKCALKGIPVLGTKETAPPLDMMRYGGFLMSKLMFECGLEVHKDRILVVGKGRLANNIVKFLSSNGIEFHHLRSGNTGQLDFGDWDAIVVAEFDDDDMVIGPGGVIDPHQLAKQNRSVQIVQICGTIDEPLIRKLGLSLHPDQTQPGFMTVSADYLGPKASIELNAAGLKVGEIMSRYRLENGYEDAVALSMKHEIVDGW